ncbi:TolC family protein, partial [Candidatus Poribacteria bacterium]|nr:TolC family protein [Candidatus Poribacteria bacterium]
DITGELLNRGRVEIPPPGQAVDISLQNRMELMRSDISIEVSEIDRDVSRDDLLPNLDFDAGYAQYDSGGRFGESNDLERNTFDAGLSLRIPLQNVQRRESHRQSVLRHEQELTDQLSTERSIIQDALSSHRAVLTTEARLTVLKKRVEQARRNLELINGSFEVGFSTITEVRLAQDDLFDAETAYSNAILGYQISIAQLYVALGLPLN